MIRICLILLLYLSGFILKAQEMIGWTLVSDNKERSIYLKNIPIPTSSESDTELEYSEDNRGIVKHWIQITYKNGGEKKWNKIVSHKMEIWEFDLKNKMIRTERLYIYGKDGKVIYEEEYDNKFDYVIPGSVGEGIYNTVDFNLFLRDLKMEIEKKCAISVDEVNDRVLVADNLCKNELYGKAILEYNQILTTIDTLKCEVGDLKEQVSKKIVLAKQGNMIYKQFLSLLVKADSVYSADIKVCIPYYKECLKVKVDVSVEEKIKYIEKELKILEFKGFVSKKKNEYDSLNKIFMLNDSLILKVLILDKEHFTTAYNIIYNDFLNTSYHRVFLKEYFFRKKDLEITSVDEQVKEHLKLFSDEYKNIISIQSEIIKTDRKVIKSQNRKFKKCDFTKNTIISILNDKGD